MWYLFAAYAAIFGLIFAYVVRLEARVRQLERRLEQARFDRPGDRT